MKRLKGQLGQSMLEYMLVTIAIIGVLIMVMAQLKRNDFFFKNFTSPLVSYLKYNYKYGDHRALGWDEEGGPRRHILIAQPNEGNTFRVVMPKRRNP